MDEAKRQGLVARIKFLLENKFPEVRESDFETGNGGFSEANAALAMESLAHNAVHVNDKKHRDTMRDLVCSGLAFGGELTAADRAWLIYIISKPEDMRHESKGRATRSDDKFELTVQLIGFMHWDGNKYPNSAVDDRLKRAAEGVCSKHSHSYSTLKALYYSDDYKKLNNYVLKRGLLDQ